MFIPFGQDEAKLCFRKRAIKIELREERLIIALGQTNFREALQVGQRRLNRLYNTIWIGNYQCNVLRILENILRHPVHSLRKTVGKVSPILVTLTSRSDSDFERSNVSLKENKPDGVNPNSNDIDYYIRKNEGKFFGFR